MYSSQGQFEQAKFWRGMNLSLGLPASILAAVSGRVHLGVELWCHAVVMVGSQGLLVRAVWSVDGANAVVAGADQVGAAAAVVGDGGQCVLVAGDGLMWFGAFEGLFAGVVRPGHGEVAGEGPDLVGFVVEAGGEVVSGVVALGSVAVAVGGDAPPDCVVVAFAQVGEELGGEVVAPVGGGVGDRGGGFAEHGADVCGPVLLGGVQLQDAFGVADQMGCALPDSGELGVELVPAGVVVATR
jgi:hypothetical protein